LILMTTIAPISAVLVARHLPRDRRKSRRDRHPRDPRRSLMILMMMFRCLAVGQSALRRRRAPNPMSRSKSLTIRIARNSDQSR
jgi:hypothetical protein